MHGRNIRKGNARKYLPLERNIRSLFPTARQSGNVSQSVVFIIFLPVLQFNHQIDILFFFYTFHAVESLYINNSDSPQFDKVSGNIRRCAHQGMFNRPALQLTGYFDYFEKSRIEIIGRVEHTYVQKLSTEEKLDVYRKFLSYHVPCVIFSRDLEPEPEFLKIATENDTPVLSTDYGTSAFMAELIYYLGEVLAPCISIHGVLVDVYGEGLFTLPIISILLFSK